MLKKDLASPSTILGPTDFGSVICPEIQSHGPTPVEVLALFSSSTLWGSLLGGKTTTYCSYRELNRVFCGRSGRIQKDQF